ncbi:MAG: DEAD/DEAH box helicase [Candidatus Aenigmatarchaeota archaeon]
MALLKNGTMESREYQKAILDKARKTNLMVVLPTGLGKTPIAVMLAAERLEKFPESKVLVMAPTKPLVSQHMKTFQKFMNMPDYQMGIVTGAMVPKKRTNSYLGCRLVFATPQTIQNDIKNGRVNLREFSLLVIDEIHHGVGRYAYPFVAQAYLETAENPKILGLTASPTSEYEKVREICDKCGIDAIEIRTENDSDVSPYVQEKSVIWEEVVLPGRFYHVKEMLDHANSERTEKLVRLKFLRSARVSKKGLLELQGSLARSAREGYKKAFLGLSLVGQSIKIEHALLLLETQGIKPLETYLKKLREDPKAKGMIGDPYIHKAMMLTEELSKAGASHPKIARLASIVSGYFKAKPDAKIIIFANFRETVEQIESTLKKIDGAKPIAFMGQKSHSQKEQKKILEEFRAGQYNALVCTSIGEEGLDIPSMDLAIFYEPVPSEIRSIQRRGRVGRQVAGEIVILITKGTRDEAYYWSAKNKEQRMKNLLYGMRGGAE